MAELADDVDAEPGAVLVDQGRVGQECYVILEGEASVYVSGEHVATSGPGSMVGEMALVEHKPRNATVVADTPDEARSCSTPRRSSSCSRRCPRRTTGSWRVLAARLRRTPTLTGSVRTPTGQARSST